MQDTPKHRNEVNELVDKGEKKSLVDSEFQRRKIDTGERVRARREELGYTRADLAKLTGISESTISFIEQGRSAPNLETLTLVCEGLQCSADYVIGLRDRNYDDVMRDAKTAHVVRMFLKFSKRHKDEALWFIEALAERIKKHGG